MNKSYLLIMLLLTQLVLLCIQLVFGCVNAILLTIPEVMIWVISYYILKKYK